MAENLKKYRVVNSPVLHNGQVAEIGEEIQLSDKEAKSIQPFIEPVKEKKSDDGGKK